MTAKRLFWILPLLAAFLFATNALAQHDHGDHGHGKKQDDAKAAARVGDAYSLSTCPISGKKLGSMGDPVVKLYERREVRYCCGGCIAKFEKDLAASLSALDAKTIADQGSLYPLDTSVVSGKKLPEKAHEFVYGNRLVRVADEKEKAEFGKEPAKFLKVLDAAVVNAQGKDYVLKQCPVSADKYGGDMGDPVDLVVGGRLVRLCCKSCKDDVEKTPAKFVELVDAARKKVAEAKAGEANPDKPKEKK
ncbi:MAG: hypothetical protein WAT39_21220 [Planctomycetota bacterium]